MPARRFTLASLPIDLLRWSRAGMIAACASSCALDKLDVVSELPCTESSTRPECALGMGGTTDPGNAGGGGVGDDGAGGGASSLGEGSGGNPPLDNGSSPDAAGPDPPVSVVDKLDLLFMIDNSISMRDKQNVLGLVNTTLFTNLANPPCVAIADSAHRSSDDPCPDGQMRAFQPITDIHIGIISSSLGDAGADVACPSEGFATYRPDRLDMAHLIGRLPRGSSIDAAQDGFLRWKAGEDTRELTLNFQRLVSAVGEAGCGWEMSLESWYRFLIDPAPYRALEKVDCLGGESTAPNCVQPSTDAQGRVLPDEELLTQRQLFLRPDSLVAIVMLTDENDCSIQVGRQSWVVVGVDDPRPMFRASDMCETNPNNPCCYICALPPPLECGTELDPACAVADPPARLLPEEDGPNLRCFDHKRRFGFDFLYPTERYVNALAQRELCLESPSLDPATCPSPASIVDNPLYALGQRKPEDVFLMGIVGVPWQHLAASVDEHGNELEADVLRFKSADELMAGDWAFILGDPQASPPELPGSPFMRESSTPRVEIANPNEINGHDYDTSLPSSPAIPDDLEYACSFELPAPRECVANDPNAPNDLACDCVGAVDTPLCEEEPGVSEPALTQYRAKAYPGLRQLDVLRGYGANSVVTSICARNVAPAQAGAPDFAYRPALNALVERLQQRLAR